LRLGYALQTVWAVLFVWYVVTRIRVVKGRRPQCPVWHNPVAAARAFWLELWELPHIAWGLLGAIVGSYCIACLGSFVWLCASAGWPTGPDALCLKSLMDVRAAQAAQLLLRPDFIALTWRELFDAVSFYPMFQLGPAADAVTGISLLAFVGWIWRNRVTVAPPRRIAPEALKEAWGFLSVGFLALVGLGAVGLMRRGPGAEDVDTMQAVLSLITMPVVHGGALAALCLLFADISLALPLDAKTIARRWLRMLPSFALLAGFPVLVRVLAEVALPGWEADRLVHRQGAAAGWWLATRAAWVLVMPIWLYMAYTRQPLSRAYRQTPNFWATHWRSVIVAALRAVVVLMPVLVSVRTLSVLAPPHSLLPGSLSLLASWLVGVVTLGAVMHGFREMISLRPGGHAHPVTLTPPKTRARQT